MYSVIYTVSTGQLGTTQMIGDNTNNDYYHMYPVVIKSGSSTKLISVLAIRSAGGTDPVGIYIQEFVFSTGNKSITSTNTIIQTSIIQQDSQEIHPNNIGGFTLTYITNTGSLEIKNFNHNLV